MQNQMSKSLNRRQPKLLEMNFAKPEPQPERYFKRFDALVSCQGCKAYSENFSGKGHINFLIFFKVYFFRHRPNLFAA